MPKKETSITTLERKSPVAALKERVKSVKKLLPKGWRSVLIRNHPKYDSMAGATLLDNVLMGRSSDVALTEILESIASGEIK